MSEHKSITDPVVLCFGDKAVLNMNKPVDTNSEYTLFTYLNKTIYYLARGSGKYRTNDGSEQYTLELTSVRNKDIIKSN